MSSYSTERERKHESKSGGSGNGQSVTLYLRSGAAGPAARRQDAVRERFGTLQEAGALPEASVERWAKAVTIPVDGDGADADAVALYEEFAAAVEAADGRLEPFFQRRERRGGLLVGRPEGEVLTFPVCCLAVRRGGTLTGLYPCWLAGTHHSVEDGLDALRDGGAETLRE